MASKVFAALVTVCVVVILAAAPAPAGSAGCVPPPSVCQPRVGPQSPDGGVSSAEFTGTRYGTSGDCTGIPRNCPELAV